VSLLIYVSGNLTNPPTLPLNGINKRRIVAAVEVESNGSARKVEVKIGVGSGSGIESGKLNGDEKWQCLGGIEFLTSGLI
jgi:hypothetical protein